MGDVGLLLVGPVLFVNGLASLGLLSGRSAAPLNLFVGAAQVILPTLVLLQAGGDPAIINATWPSYLFGFTYLWFGLINLAGFEPQGFGWFSAFVAGVAAYQALVTAPADPVFAVIWLTWAIMWTLFFLLLALGVQRVGRVDLGRATGWFLVLLGIPTCSVSAIFLLNGSWTTTPESGLVALAGLVAAAVLSTLFARARVEADAAAPAEAALVAD
ncbi:MAG: AmiS/UreI family transporter [Protaetiibacter sp.]